MSNDSPPSSASDVRVIPPLDLAAEREFLGPELEDAVLAVLRSGQYVLGPEVQRLEADFAKLCGTTHGVGVSSGTEALVVALRALGVGPGDEVLTSPFSFFASAGTIAWVGARPTFCDVDPETALLDPGAARAAVTESTKAIVPVHLYGQMADMQAFRALCDERGLAILEDAAQAHGATRDGVGPGGLGDAAAFSFYPTKNLGAAGEGGMLVTRSDAVATRMREIRDHGSPTKYVHTHVGTNARMHAFQGAVLNVKLPHLAAWNARRNAVATIYDDAFGGTSVRPLARVPNSTHAFHQYTVRVADRDRVQAELGAAGVIAGVHYPVPIHLQEAARDWGFGPGDFPNAEALAGEVLCLPVHPFLSDEDATRVAEAVRTAAGV